MKVGHGAQLGAEPKNAKIFNFFKFFKFSIFSIFNPFFIQNGVFLWVLNGAKNDYFSEC